jgi:hypothetical protein
MFDYGETSLLTNVEVWRIVGAFLKDLVMIYAIKTPIYHHYIESIINHSFKVNVKLRFTLDAIDWRSPFYHVVAYDVFPLNM